MKKSILNIGEVLSKSQQKTVLGGFGPSAVIISGTECEDKCTSDSDCDSGETCETFNFNKTCDSPSEYKRCI